MDNDTFTENNANLDSLSPSVLTIWSQTHFKFLALSEIAFIISLILWMASGTLLLAGYGDNIMLLVIFFSCAIVIFSGIATLISALYIFFKTIKRKDPISYTHNIFSRYTIMAYLISAVYLFLIYKVFDLYSKVDNLEFLSMLPFIFVNIAGFIHLAILNNKYKAHK